MSARALVSIVDDCLRRELFTLEEAIERVSQPDMRERRGAQLLRDVVRSRTS